MKNKFLNITLIGLCLAIFLPFSFAGEVNNGGGFSEQNFLFAYSNLERFIDPCLSTEVCKIDDSERKILAQIKKSLVDERRANSYPLFKSGRLNEFNFNINGALRIAATGFDIGDPIYINLDLIYPKDFDGSTRALRVDEAVAVLIHELGHHHMVKDHQKLDFLGTKIQLASQGEVQLLSGLKGRIRLTLINRVDPTSIPNFMTLGLPTAIFSNYQQSVDIGTGLIENIKCDFHTEVLTGVSFRNLKWKEELPVSLNKTKLLLRACVAVVCASSPNFSKLKQKNMEFEVGLDLKNSTDGYSYYEFDGKSIKAKDVVDWLPCE